MLPRPSWRSSSGVDLVSRLKKIENGSHTRFLTRPARQPLRAGNPGPAPGTPDQHVLPLAARERACARPRRPAPPRGHVLDSVIAARAAGLRRTQGTRREARRGQVHAHGVRAPTFGGCPRNARAHPRRGARLRLRPAEHRDGLANCSFFSVLARSRTLSSPGYTLTRPCVRRVLFLVVFPSAPSLRCTESASDPSELFLGFTANVERSDSSGSCTIGYGSSPSRCGPPR